jgi:hypothetical protein
MEKRDEYLSYMLRLWRVSRDGQGMWWASLENSQTGKRHNFSDLENLFAFLRGLSEGLLQTITCQEEQ